MIVRDRWLLGIALGLGIACTPVLGRATQPAGNLDMEKKIVDLGEACATMIMARAPRHNPRCPGKIEAVAKLGDAAVPELVRQIKLYSGNKRIFDDRPHVMAQVLGRIGTPLAIGALVNLLGDPEVQKSTFSPFWSIHEALLARTGAKIEGNPRDQAALAAKWRAWWEEHQPKGAA